MLKNINYELLLGDCLEVMKDIPGKFVDAIITDLPYGVLNKKNKNAKWDCPIDLKLLWEQYLRIIKDNGAIILFGNGMFTADLMKSNPKLWRYNLIWDKVQKTGFLNAKRMPLRQHEDIVVFYKKLGTYNPQMTKCEPHKRNHSRGNLLNQQKNSCYGQFVEVPSIISDEKYPTSIITISKEHCVGKFFHGTQKPVGLLEYLIKTYTNEGEIVLDSCAGSMTTAIAAINTNRKVICIEKDEAIFETGKKRVLDYINDNKGGVENNT